PLQVRAEERARAAAGGRERGGDEPRDRALAVRASHEHDPGAGSGEAGLGQQRPDPLQPRPHAEALQAEQPVEGGGAAHVSSSQALIISASGSPRVSWWCLTSQATLASPEASRTIRAP